VGYYLNGILKYFGPYTQDDAWIQGKSILGNQADGNFVITMKGIRKDGSLIEKYGWYKAKNNGNNLGGVSRDHMLSVSEGYKLSIDPYFLSHPANCKLMVHSENISKNKKSQTSSRSGSWRS
jgi:hypothetical protein